MTYAISVDASIEYYAYSEPAPFEPRQCLKIVRQGTSPSWGPRISWQANDSTARYLSARLKRPTIPLTFSI